MRNEGRSLAVVLGWAVLLVAGAALDASGAPPAAKPVEPDLYVASFTAEKIGVLGDGSHRVRLTAKVGMRSPVRASTGPFKLTVEWKSVAPGPLRRTKGTLVYTLLQEGGVAGLSYDPTSRIVSRMATRTFEATVPAGTERQFRLTIDSMRQVAEADETNNQATVRYRAPAFHLEVFCSGVDLRLTRMRFQRRPDGDTVVDVWVKNLCSDPCEAGIFYSIDQGEAVPGAGSVERTIMPRIGGETEVGPVGATIVDGVAGSDATYTVRIGPVGGACTENSDTNNSCRGTIRAGETTRTFDCTLPTYSVYR